MAYTKYNYSRNGKTIKGTVYQSQQLYNNYGDYPLKVMVDYIGMVLENQAIQNNYIVWGVTSEKINLSTEDVKCEPDPNPTPLGEFTNYLNGSPVAKYKDFNLCITVQNINFDDDAPGCANGIAAVTQGGLNLDKMGANERSRFGTDNGTHKAVNVGIQEIGHNMSIDHANGMIRYNSNQGRTEVTPMMTTYEGDFAGSENSCGQSTTNSITNKHYDHYYSSCALSNMVVK